MQIAEVGHFSNHSGEFTGQIIIINIKNLQVLEPRKLARNGPIKDVTREIKKLERREGGNLRWDSAGKFVEAEGNISEKAKRGNVRGKGGGKVKGREV